MARRIIENTTYPTGLPWPREKKIRVIWRGI
jgi:hypothetical protein